MSLAYGTDIFAGTPAARDGAVAWMTIMGIPQDREQIEQYRSLEDFARAPADESWVYACAKRKWQSAQSVPLRVYVRVGKDLVPSADEPSPEGDDLQTLLDYVNPIDMTGSDLKAYTRASLDIWGGCYWKKVRGRLLRDVKELYWLRAPDVRVKSDNGRLVSSYEHRPSKGPLEVIEPRDIVPFRGVNLNSTTDIVSPLSAARYDMVVQQVAPQHTAATLRNRGVPEGYWKAAKGVEPTRQDLSAIRRFIRQLRGPKNAGKSLVSPDIEYQTLALSPKDAEWLAARKVSRMTVSAVLGVPLVLAGDDEKASVYANLRDAERSFWKGTMIPDLDATADAINNWLVPDFDPSRRRLVVAFDYSEIEAIKPLPNDEWQMWLSAIEHQAVVPNEFRRHFRIGKDVDWGERPIPRTTITLRDPTFPLPSGTPADTTTTPSAPMLVEPSGEPGDLPDVSASLRAFGRSLYRQPAVRAFVTFGGPLDMAHLVGYVVPDAVRRQIEEGLRRRQSAEQIAASLSEGVAP